MIDETICKIAIAGYLHDIGKFAERAHNRQNENSELSHGFYPNETFLLNNIALYQPCYNGKYTHKHAVYTAAFVDHIEQLLPERLNKGKWGLGDSFINLAAMHHKPETPLQWIIAMADRVSSGFDRDEFKDYNSEIKVKDYKKTRLLTIFEGISTDNHWKDDNLESYAFRYPLKELSPENIFPENEKQIDNTQAQKEYSDLFLSFVSSLEKLCHKEKNLPLWFEHFDSLFMIYTSHIPAATVGKVVPDVSLYDHSKMTAALASAIYLYHKQNNSMNIEQIKNDEKKKFLILNGDFYGIQNFIFSEGGSTNKEAAKLLRGRSFAVSLISELAADMLCRQIGVTTASVVLSAAGKFTIIVPNTAETRDMIKKVEEQINDWLIKMFYGESALGISFVETSYSDFTSRNFSDFWNRLGDELEKKKYSKLNLEKYGGVIKGYFEQFNNDLYEKLCPFCGKRPSSENFGDESSACGICRDHIYIGTNLVKAERIAITAIDADIYGDKLKEPFFGEYQVSFDVTKKLNDLAEKGTLLRYWDISICKDGNIARDITAKFINGYVPFFDESDSNDMRYLHGTKGDKRKLEMIEQMDIGKPKTFSHIACKALNPTDKQDDFTGVEALGVLKADVDKLGLIFGLGLKRNSLSRMTTLSRQINHYFSIYLPYILSSREEFKDIYTVFSGGDDLFLIGPWNRIIDFAIFLHESFSKYVCQNKQITISAGISIHKQGEPVLSIAERSEHALKKSKDNERDSITLFDESIKWDDFHNLEKIKKQLYEWIEKKFINNAMLFNFNNFADMAKQEKELLGRHEGVDMEEWECLKWRARFKYNLVRNTAKDLEGDKKEGAVKEVEKAFEWFINHGGAMKIPVWQVIYNQR
ncbi:MAG: type III-A CRISPR-associated protein Cas10/Csm1 [bacterium]|nr:type III-A CRISPR-associated protein Cas10/Csm1 [bacterium]